MSKYYTINDLTVRVSDHEANTSLNGSNDIELYVKSADNRLISVTSQLENICERRGYNLADFADILNEWQDGSYTKDVFCNVANDDEDDNCSLAGMAEMRTATNQTNDEKLKGHSLPKGANHSEVKALSELISVSQSYIKKHFNIK